MGDLNSEWEAGMFHQTSSLGRNLNFLDLWSTRGDFRFLCVLVCSCVLTVFFFLLSLFNGSVYFQRTTMTESSQSSHQNYLNSDLAVKIAKVSLPLLMPGLKMSK